MEISCSQSWWAVGVWYSALLVASFLTMKTFNKYCESVAKFENREVEFNDRDVDEGELNAYKREHLWKLLNGYYLEFPLENLRKRGRVIFLIFFLVMTASIISVVATPIFFNFACDN